ncbi:MAG TPA: hypothetical protein VMF07_19900 [Solirubrobacteraceae bacterium]|nr:hypothetical protein [Solirubrobacteraceae bacterium]
MAALGAGQAKADIGVPSYVPSSGLGPVTPAATTNSFYGGYEGGKPFSGVPSVGSTFIVPKFKCPVDALNFYGAAIFDSQGFFQAGASLSIECAGGVASYGLNAETALDNDDEVGVKPGDKIIVSLSETASDTTATAADVTSGVSAYADDGVGDATGNPSANFNIGVFDDSGTTPQYKSIVFSNDKVNAIPLGLLRPRAQALDLMSGSDIQEKTSKIKGINHASFTMTYVNTQ